MSYIATLNTGDPTFVGSAEVQILRRGKFTTSQRITSRSDGNFKFTAPTGSTIRLAATRFWPSQNFAPVEFTATATKNLGSPVAPAAPSIESKEWFASTLAPATYIANPDTYTLATGNVFITEGQLAEVLNLIGDIKAGGGGGSGAPGSTDLASIAWAADKAPTFTNPAILPIGDWATNIFDQTSADGIKTTTNFSIAAANHDLARQHGLPGAFWIDTDGDGAAGPYEGTVGSETELWGIGDEWDMRDSSGAVTGVWATGDGALALAQAEAAMIPADMLRYGNFGKGVLYGPSAKATPFLSLVNVASADAYPYTDHEFSVGGYPQCQYLGLSASGGEAVRRAASYCLIQRRMRERLDMAKPTGQVIELTAISGKATVSAAQAVGAAWAAIIGGASFIIWFYQQPWIAPADGVYAAGTTYSWPASVTYGGKTYGTRPQVTTTTGVTPGTNDDVWGEISQQWLGSYNQGAAYQSALAEFKSRAGGIARALRSDSIAHTATAGVNTRVVSDGTYLYLLAQPAHSWASGTSYTLNLPAGVTATSADVMWSGGATAPVSGGAIAGVTFAKEYMVRVYRVEI